MALEWGTAFAAWAQQWGKLDTVLPPGQWDKAKAKEDFNGTLTEMLSIGKRWVDRCPPAIKDMRDEFDDFCMAVELAVLQENVPVKTMIGLYTHKEKLELKRKAALGKHWKSLAILAKEMRANKK